MRCHNEMKAIKDIFYNTMHDLVSYFSTPQLPVSTDEFVKFWQSLSVEERVYWRLVPLVDKNGIFMQPVADHSGHVTSSLSRVV